MPSPGQPAAGAWAPPPKPGLIPLRPLEFGVILAAPYQALRRNPRPTFGTGLVLQSAIVFLTLLVAGLVAWATLSRVDFASTSADTESIIAGSIGAIALAALVPAALAVPATAIMQGLIVLEIARQTVGERLRLPRLWALATGRIWALVGYSVAFGAAWFVAIGLIVVVVAVLSVTGTAGVVIGILLAIVLSLALLAAGFWLTTKLAFVPSAIMLERLPITRAIARSWTLTRGSFWKILGTMLLVSVILGFASSLVSTPIQVITGIAGSLFAPTGDQTALIVIVVISYLVLLIAVLVVSAISLVVQSATTVLLYIDQRIRKEGLDLDLARYVEQRDAGTSPVDPFESVRPAASAPPAPPATPAASAPPWV
ncbi:MAG: glycerophosphoryl diester phosphodiesterase membrane domain-containing protein [Burkholderiaceae bacterium]|nr:glycerophosphoryl diester phosphodiesterase membrane domain-containing protein [Microbacteriaceae bacterium]